MNPDCERRLKQALTGVMRAALAEMSASLGEQEVPIRTRTHFKREYGPESGDVGLVQVEEKAIDPEPLWIAIYEVLTRLPEANEFREIVVGDAELHGLLKTLSGEFVETQSTQESYLRQWLFMPYFKYYLERRTNLEWDEGTFDAVFPDLVRHADGEPLPLELLAPLQNFQSTLELVELDERTRIASLTDEELSLLYDEWDQRRWADSKVTPINLLDWTHAIKHETQRVVAPGLGEGGTTPVQDALTALRLLRESGVKTAFVWERPQRFSFIQGGSGHVYQNVLRPMSVFGPGLELLEDDVDPVTLFFSQLRGAKNQVNSDYRRFELAVRRLNAGVERHSHEDRLIDYWVALEALFVSDSRGAIIHRASTRLARYLGDNLASRREIAKVLRDSYKRRSEVVHGDKPKDDLPQLTDETGGILRRALVRSLEDGAKIDLEELDLS